MKTSNVCIIVFFSPGNFVEEIPDENMNETFGFEESSDEESCGIEASFWFDY